MRLRLRPCFSRERLGEERGFTMFAVTGAMLVIMLLSVAAFAAAGGDQEGARYDQDHKRAYSAAEAGVHWYLSRLRTDDSFWAKCDEVTLPDRVYQPWDGKGTDPRTPRTKVPGSDAEFVIELLPAKDAVTKKRHPKCDRGAPNRTMIDPRSGVFQIRSTGFARGAKRSIVASFRQKGFLDYLWFTDLEAAPPAAYRVRTGGHPSQEDVQTWAQRECSRWYRLGRSRVWDGSIYEPSRTRNGVRMGCMEVTFHPEDEVKGPLHTNDEMRICGSAEFGRGPGDAIESSGRPPGYRLDPGCGSGLGTPKFHGKLTANSPVLPLPSSNAELKPVAQADGYVFTGRTVIQFAGNNVKINGDLMPLPANGVIYVQNGTCGAFYDPTRTDPAETPTGCGDAYVSGPYAGDVTIAAEKDIIIEGNLTKAGDTMLGLIANNFVRVAHPVTNRTAVWDSGDERYDWRCDNVGGSPVRQIDAAILALNYSFTVDNYYCGRALGDLTLNGAIAQKSRGLVATQTPWGQAGYLKDYNYDDRLHYRQPPHFLDPVTTAWRVSRQVEQTPPR